MIRTALVPRADANICRGTVEIVRDHQKEEEEQAQHGGAPLEDEGRREEGDEFTPRADDSE